MALGELVRQLRTGRNWTQEQLAEAANVSQATVSQIEIGRIERPSYEYMRRIAGGLGVPISTLMEAAGLIESDGATAETAQEEIVRTARKWLEGRPALAERLERVRAKYGDERFEEFLLTVFRAWESNLEMALTLEERRDE